MLKVWKKKFDAVSPEGVSDVFARLEKMIADRSGFGLVIRHLLAAALR
jgi:hypothetical protein